MPLPEKQYFSIEEILKRWNCEYDALIQYLESRKIYAAIKWHDLPGEQWEGEIPGSDMSSKLLAEKKLLKSIVYIWDFKNLKREVGDYGPVIILNNTILVYDVERPNVWFRVKPERAPTYTTTEDAFIITVAERNRFEKVNDLKISIMDKEKNKTDYINPSRLEEIKSISHPDFDLKRIVSYCLEINSCYRNGNYHAIGMLLRSLMDHVPPIFNAQNFSGVYNNYSGTKSFKQMMEYLDKQLRKIADSYLHTHISNKEVLPNETQIDFRQGLDVLLSEIIKLLAR
ncbi:hypothetical protein ACFLSX_02340 [Calditrichota bacterium]